jgi:hypothetical protein
MWEDEVVEEVRAVRRAHAAPTAMTFVESLPI